MANQSYYIGTRAVINDVLFASTEFKSQRCCLRDIIARKISLLQNVTRIGAIILAQNTPDVFDFQVSLEED